MIRATQIHSAGSWSQAASDTVVLEFDDRHRRRTVMSGVQGLAFLLDLDEAVMLRGGDALELEDGRLVEVVSAPERLMEVRARSPGDLLRLAWHIGNRHLPAQLLASAIRLREDHVIEQMLRGLGAKITSIEGPFDPEGGAYAARGGQSHRHGADETDDHSHHEHAHAPHHDHGGKHDHHHDHGSAAHDRSVAKHHHDH